MKAITKLYIKKFFKIDIWNYALILGFVCLTAYIFDKEIEAFFFLVCHYVMRPKFSKQLHVSPTALCLSVTCFIAFIGITTALHLSVSLLSTIPITIIICWFGYVIQDRLDLRREVIRLKKIAVPYKFNLDTCTEAELIEQCRLKFKRDVQYKTERAIKHFILKLPHEEIDINPRTSQTERQRMKHLLTK